jgi:hypothetical protein
MTAEEITKIRRGKEKAYHRQWDNYQATGAANYYNAAKRYADLVEICDQALAAADDHAEALHLRGSFSQLASRADDILLQRYLWIDKGWDYHMLWEKLFPIGVDMVLEAMNIIGSNRAVWKKQDERFATWEPSWERPRLKRNELIMIGG